MAATDSNGVPYINVPGAGRLGSRFEPGNFPQPWEMTPQQIAPHQVPVDTVDFIREYQVVTGDTWRAYRAPDGEVFEVRVKCGTYAREGTPVWTDTEARPHAITRLNEKRRGRAERIAQGLPVTVQLKATGE
jgi:hypothetical protein